MLRGSSSGCAEPLRLLLLRAANSFCSRPSAPSCPGRHLSFFYLFIFFFLGAEAMAKVPDRSRHKWSALHTFLRCNMNPETQRVVVFVILLFLIIVNVVLMFLLAFH